MSEQKKGKSGFFKGCLGCLGFIVILGIIIGGCTAMFSGEDKKKSEKTEQRETVKVPKYKIFKDDFRKGGIWYLSLETATTNEKEITSLIKYTKELANDKKQTVSAIFVRIFKMDSPSNNAMATAKVALTEIGKAQTGLEELGKYEIKMNIMEEHSKKVAKSKNEGPTASKVLEAFKKENLSVPESRENQQVCLELDCVTLITTEAISIYEWPDTEKAKKVQDEYNFGTYQAGPIILRMNDDSLNSKEYINVLNELIK